MFFHQRGNMSNSPVSGISSVGISRVLPWLFFGGFFCAAYLPVITGLIQSWSQSEDYSHGFVIVPLSIFILWRNRAFLGGIPVRGSWFGLVVSTGALLVYLVASKGEIQTAAAVSMVIFVWGGVVFLFGRAMFKAIFFPLIILLMMIPVPAQILASLTIPLQLLVTGASVRLASLTGVPIVHEGNVINLPLGAFEVVQACSGLRSIMSLLTLGVLVGYFTLRSNLTRGFFLLLAIPVALLVNILRVFILIVVFHYVAIDLSKGPLHTILGLFVFVTACGMFFLVGKGLSAWEK